MKRIKISKLKLKKTLNKEQVIKFAETDENIKIIDKFLKGSVHVKSCLDFYANLKKINRFLF